MEPNNFEKNVQQKMDELKIPPPDFVWANIEKKIGKRERSRKRHSIFLFIPFASCARGYWFINPEKSGSKSKQINGNVVKQDSKTTNTNDSSSHQFALTILKKQIV